MKRLITGAIGVALASSSLAFAGAPAKPPLVNGPNHPARVGGIRGGPGYNDTSSVNWSGYAALAGSKPFTAVIGKWQVPKVTCLGLNWPAPPYEADAFWVGLDGFENSSVQQGGTIAFCNGTAEPPEYIAFFEMYPQQGFDNQIYTVFPGDSITASVTFGNNLYKIVVNDTTSGHQHSFSTLQQCAAGLVCSRQSAEWIGERPGYLNTNLAEWTNSKGQAQIGFYAGFATATGAKKTAMGNLPGLWNIEMVNGGDTLAAPGSPGRQKQGFQDYWYAES
jgi:hypothetical protein